MPELCAELEAVSVLAELDRMGWAYQFAGEDEIKCHCPSHKDETPSCGINVRKKLWKCQACQAKGDFITFMAIALKSTRIVVMEHIRQTYDVVASEATVDTNLVEQCHEAIWQAGPLLQELRDRGLSDETIRKYRIGYDAGKKAITIPVANEHGSWVNIRSYKPGAPAKEKFRNLKGKGTLRLYPVDQLQYETIVICGGEVKALVVAQHLNAHGIGAIAGTGGENNWETGWSNRLRNKRVYVCYDIDKAGRQGATLVAARVSGPAEWTGVVELPLDADKHPKGDVNDYFGAEKKTADDFLKVLENTPPWAPDVIEPDGSGDLDPQKVHLSESSKAHHTRRRIQTDAVVTAMDPTPYIVPKDVDIECNRDETLCAVCPVFAQDEKESFVRLTISAESPALVTFVNAGQSSQDDAIREGLGIPPCKSATFHVRSHYNVEDVRLTPRLELSSRHADSVMQPALFVNHGTEMNIPYTIVGRLYPHPRTQQATLLISDAQPAEDSLNTCTFTDEELQDLSVFQPDEWTVDSLRTKLRDLYDDFAANVTRIFQRRDIHLFVDLAYHSPLLLRFDGRVEKGWSELLIVGDSSQGKSETSRRLMEHYTLGEKVEVKNASVAGLLGGLQQLGSRWMVTWGMIPRHDRRLVILEELKGASTEIIAKLTDMRSSGVAELDKIEKRRAHARTRLLALSNPRSDQPVASYAYGVEALRELIGGLEDLRRFDAALIVSASEVEAETMNMLAVNRPQHPHVHSSELCKRCVLWAWTRTEDQVYFEPDAQVAALMEANRLCSKYVEALPLIDRGSARLKIARLAAALACRTASFGESPQDVLVRECHVRYITETLDRIYSSPVMGYDAFSASYSRMRGLKDVEGLKRKLASTPFPKDLVEHILFTDSIEQRDICDWIGLDEQAAYQLVSFLVRRHAFVRDGRGYRKTPSFISLLNELKSTGYLERAEKPGFIEERRNDM